MNTPPPPKPSGMSRTSILCLQFPIVTTTLWGQLTGKTMTILPRSLLLYCTVMFVYVYQTPTFPPHYKNNVKIKSQHICQAITVLLRGLYEAVATNDGALFIAYDALHVKFSSQPPPPPPLPKKYILTPNTKYDTRFILFNLFPSTFPPHHLILFLTSTV